MPVTQADLHAMSLTELAQLQRLVARELVSRLTGRAPRRKQADQPPAIGRMMLDPWELQETH